MTIQEKSKLLKSYLEKVSPGIFDNRENFFEGLEAKENQILSFDSSLEVLSTDNKLTPQDTYSIEAIVHKKYRPAIFIINNTYEMPPNPWQHFDQEQARTNIEKNIPLIGRIELPGIGIPYGGTGFVVGSDLIMTNRHVAEMFARGLGISRLRFKSRMEAGINFRKEIVPSPDVKDLRVVNVVMIHPHWDMALLRVEGLPENQRPLSLSTHSADDMIGRDIAVIGYPAQDSRNDIALQNEIFGGVYNVKRMQPGKLDPRARILSFGQEVDAITHDASTLGGNSGSAVIDVQTGDVIALHFAGIYLKSNYAVPTYELARDQRVVDSGINFQGNVPPSDEWSDRWAVADSLIESNSSSLSVGPQSALGDASDGSRFRDESDNTNQISITIPLTITVSLGNSIEGGSLVSASTAGDLSETLISQEGNFGGGSNVDILSKAYEKSNAILLKVDSYSAKSVVTAAAASALVYSDVVERIKTVCSEKFGFNTCKYLRNNNTECFVASSADTVLVSFRGTLGVRDWIANMNLVAQATEFGMVHGGFLQGYLDINTALENEVDSVISNRQLVLTGHSLGGALATIAASEWRHTYNIRSIYTFGQPAVGDQEFRESMNQFKARFYRVVNDDDIVTKMPPTYRHVGTKISLPSNRRLANMGIESPLHIVTDTDSENLMLEEPVFHQLQAQLDGSNQSIGTEGILPSFSDHKMTNYISKLLKLNKIS